MILTQEILEILKQYTSVITSMDTKKELQAKTLNRKEITEYLNAKYGEEITYRRVIRSLNHLLESEALLPSSQQMIGIIGAKKRHRYYYKNSISDVELKYLIDCVMHSKIFRKEQASSLAKRLQSLSNRNAVKLTPYVNDSFGEQRFFLTHNVLENVMKIQEAIDKRQYIAYDWHVYESDGKQIVLREMGRKIIKPYFLLLNDHRYFTFGRHKDMNEIYTHSVDLMDNIELISPRDVQDKGKDPVARINRGKYILNHPYMMGGEVNRYRLRVQREYFSRLVDSFSHEIEIIPGTLTDTEVEVYIKSSKLGLRYWLLQHYQVAELIECKDQELLDDLSEAVEKLYKRYHLKA
ncbi:WYL domain-containing protein [Enterococcus cecorum]|uniref:WYL domain-containing protein n=1 Tax=Enterococcus cecorum TaxID=44008 RepID=UPI0032C3EEDF